MDWARRRYRDHKVWIRVDEEGRPRLDDRGLAAMRYAPGDERTYSVRPAEISPLAPLADAGTQASVETWVAVLPGGADTWGVGIRWAWGAHRREADLAVRAPSAAAAGARGALAALEGLRRQDLGVRLHLPEDAARLLRAHAPEPSAAAVVHAVRARARALPAVELVTGVETSADASAAVRAAGRAIADVPPT